MKIDILPNEIVSIVKAEGKDLDFGVIRLEIFLRDERPRWEITRSRSIIDDTIPKSIDAVAYQKTIGEEDISRRGYGK
jgi:hypothetical protein